MRVLITGICGFVGSTLAMELARQSGISQIIGIDNFSRGGSETNRRRLLDQGISVISGDIRNASDVDSLPQADVVIDAAANPSVLAGVDGKTSSRQLIENNLYGTINLLEYCKRHSAAFTLLSTSRVYSIPKLAQLKMTIKKNAFVPDSNQDFPPGISASGVTEAYSTSPPVSLYGSSKFASEHLAIEYGLSFGFPVWINRCGVLAGPGQFGHPAQGIFAYWIHSFREGKPLRYIGFGGSGYQVRDCLHPRDLVPILKSQFEEGLTENKPCIVNISGGIENSMSLAQLTSWCSQHYPDSPTAKLLADSCTAGSPNPDRPFDIPWMVLDSRLAQRTWNWNVSTPVGKVLEQIADYADQHPNHLLLSH
jgi:CDP-paratose 2-epimerase